MVTSSNQIESKFLFSYQFEMNDCEIYLDHENQVVKIVWEGRVGVDTATNLLTYVADLLEGGLVNRVLLDRQNLIHFDQLAKDWIKDEFLARRYQKLTEKVYKVAIINECSVAALLYGNKTKGNIQFDFSLLPLQKFDKMTDAESWLIE